MGGELMRGALLALALLVAACGLPPSGPAPDPGDPGPGPGPHPTPPPGATLFLVDRPDSMNHSENLIRGRLTGLGLAVTIVDDDAFETATADGCALVVMSKSVDDEKMGRKLKSVGCGVVFWDDNQQQLRMLATINNDGSTGTTWHGQGNEIVMRGDAPADLRAGLSGTVLFYTRRDEITFARRDDAVAGATIVAELKEPGGHKVIYVFDRGAILADGTPAAGRRAYFGLFTDTFQRLSPEGLALFDALVGWARR
ncbi:MAG: hypothetical protein ABR559_01605 [Gemmatimonadota bacterium]